MRIELKAMYAAQATGCPDAGGYRAWAKAQGYSTVRALETSSSAGDWSFLISKDGETWQMMWQENNWPRAGFTRYIEPRLWHGTFDEVAEQMYREVC